MVFWVAAAVIAGMMLAVWAVSVAIRDAGIVDILWGFGFVVVAWVSWQITDGHDVRAELLVFMATAWGLRLAVHLAVRNIGFAPPPQVALSREPERPSPRPNR